jgi:predicted nucleic acid-binding protein
MTVSIDSNVVVALWWQHDPLNRVAEKMLLQAQRTGRLVVSAPVYAELMGDPNRTEAEIDRFLDETGIQIDWELNQSVWRQAGSAYRSYTLRCRTGDRSVPRGILADFLIGAHALVSGYSLLTLDRRLFHAAFPKLPILAI